ncbi:hypothetical protein BHE74_00032682 [Ensete ventricosum]|nr:hypothetical protein BHE74_00032682 [Ensete ventricosum]
MTHTPPPPHGDGDRRVSVEAQHSSTARALPVFFQPHKVNPLTGRLEMRSFLGLGQGFGSICFLLLFALDSPSSVFWGGGWSSIRDLGMELVRVCLQHYQIGRSGRGEEVIETRGGASETMDSSPPATIATMSCPQISEGGCRWWRHRGWAAYGVPDSSILTEKSKGETIHSANGVSGLRMSRLQLDCAASC